MVVSKWDRLVQLVGDLRAAGPEFVRRLPEAIEDELLCLGRAQARVSENERLPHLLERPDDGQEGLGPAVRMDKCDLLICVNSEARTLDLQTGAWLFWCVPLQVVARTLQHIPVTRWLSFMQLNCISEIFLSPSTKQYCSCIASSSSRTRFHLRSASVK